MDPADDNLISKSQRKREATALQDLGEELTRLKREQLHSLPLPAAVTSAIEEFWRLPNSHGARKRQLQLIGKRMRECDYAEVADALNALADQPSRRVRQKEYIADLAAELLDQGEPAINALLEQYPRLSRQRLRQLYREYHKSPEPAADASRRKLSDYLRAELPGP